MASEAPATASEAPLSEESTMASQSRIILIDQDNVRASMGWPPARAFRDRLAHNHSLDPMHASTAMIIEVDERRHSSGNGRDNQSANLRARQIAPHVVISFSGPRLRADDLIARDVEYWGRQPSVTEVLVVSSDKLVRRRCGEAKARARNDLRLRFETGEAFALLMPPEAAATSGGGGTVAPRAPPTEAAPAASDAEAAPANISAVAATTASVSALASAAAEFAAWVEREQPGPSKSAQDVSMAGEKSRKGNKRKLGVYR